LGTLLNNNLPFCTLHTKGFDIQCDLHQLAQSYGELECFQSYEMLLDMQKLFKGVTGGLSGLSKVDKKYNHHTIKWLWLTVVHLLLTFSSLVDMFATTPSLCIPNAVRKY